MQGGAGGKTNAGIVIPWTALYVDRHGGARAGQWVRNCRDMENLPNVLAKFIVLMHRRHVLELSIACTRVQVDLNLSAEFCDLSASLSELENSAWEAWTGNRWAWAGNRCQMAVKGEPGFACRPIDANM